MIFICTNLQKLHLVSLLNVQTDFLQHCVNTFIKHSTPVFGRQNQMIDQDGNIMTLVYILTHTPSLRRKRRGIQP